MESGHSTSVMQRVKTLCPWAWRMASQGEPQVRGQVSGRVTGKLPAPETARSSWGGSWGQDAAHTALCNEEITKMGPRKGPIRNCCLQNVAPMTPVHELRAQHSPKATVDSGFVHSSHMGTKRIFCIAEILYIYFVCNEPFSINVILLQNGGGLWPTFVNSCLLSTITWEPRSLACHTGFSWAGIQFSALGGLHPSLRLVQGLSGQMLGVEGPQISAGLKFLKRAWGV